MQRGFSVLRFNFRGVGRSQGFWDGGPGELADAASALDWLQMVKPDAKYCWIAGVSFGTWIAMQLLMRRPEIDGFICVAPPSTSTTSRSWLRALVRPHGQWRQGSRRAVELRCGAHGKLKTQRGIKIDHEIIPGANHFFENKTDELQTVVGSYLDMRLAKAQKDRETQKEREKEREAAREREREREKELEDEPIADVGGDDDE